MSLAQDDQDGSLEGDLLIETPKLEHGGRAPIDPPYPSSTRAKGWRLELDHERVRQSDTWALTPPELRPWLLMLWMVAWEQTPCGSLPDDDVLISARIGMPVEILTTAKCYLLRGWWKATDGRMYHAVLTERVLGMLAFKEKETNRKSAYRQRVAVKESVAGKDGRVCPAGPPVARRVGDDTGTGTSNTSSPDGEDKRGSRRSSSGTPDGSQKVDKPKVTKIWLTTAEMLVGNDDLPEDKAAEYLAYRRAKRAPLTTSAWAGIVEEVRKTKRPLDRALAYAMSRGWTGFDVAWLSQTQGGAKTSTRADRAQAFHDDLNAIQDEINGVTHGNTAPSADDFIDVDARRVD
jgi:hypothetical protein